MVSEESPGGVQSLRHLWVLSHECFCFLCLLAFTGDSLRQLREREIYLPAVEVEVELESEMRLFWSLHFHPVHTMPSLGLPLSVPLSEDDEINNQLCKIVIIVIIIITCPKLL